MVSGIAARLDALVKNRPLMSILFAVSLIRIVMAIFLPITEDEAYYAIWAETFQFGYYDHPPLIAWWIGLGHRLWPEQPWALRFVPIVSTALTSVLLYNLMNDSGCSRRTSLRGAIWYQATLLITLGGFLATPDNPLSLFWVMTLLLLVRAVTSEGKLLYWGLAGCSAGFALLSKYSGIFLAPGIGLWLLLVPSRRRLLLTTGPWVMASVASVIFCTNLIWNAQHGWVTFIKQFGRAVPGIQEPSGFHTLAFVGEQAMLFNPALSVLLGVAVVAYVRGRMRQGGIFLLTSAPFLFYLLWHSTHSKVQAHWTAPILPAVAALAAIAAEPIAGQRILGAARATVAPLAAIVLAVAAVFTLIPSVYRRYDVAQELRGWKELGEEIEALSGDRKTEWVGVMHYSTHAMLTYRSRLPRPTVHLYERRRYPAHDRSWHANTNRPGLVVDRARFLDGLDLSACFDRVTPVGTLFRRGADGSSSPYRVLLVSGPKRDILSEGCWDGVPLYNAVADQHPASPSTGTNP